MQPRELRLHILQALLNWAHSGDRRLPEAQQLADSIGVNLHDIVDQLDILEIDGAVDVGRALGDGSNMTAMITGVGKKMVEAAQQQSQSQSTSKSSLLDSTSRATELLEELASDLCEVTFKLSNLVAYLRKYLMAIRLLGWNEEWINKELNGYSYEDGATPWRLVDNIWYLPQPTAELIPSLQRGLSLPAWEINKSTSGYSEHKVPPQSIKNVLDKITEKLFDHVSNAVVALRFGKVTATVFRKYQESVSHILTHLGIDDQLQSAYQNLLVDNKASWPIAVLACRNILQRLSDTLWQSTEKEYSYLKDDNGAAIKVHKDNVRNRIRAYLHQKGLKDKDMLMRMIDPLYSMGSSGKRPVSYEQAQSVLIYTYIFLGEMIRLTDMQPVIIVNKI